MGNEQPILDLTESQEPEKVIPNIYMDVKMDFSDFDLGLGF